MVPRPTIALLLAALTLSSCARQASAEDRAAATFTAFQDALFRRDRTALRQLVCYDAREVVPGLCDAHLTGRKPLEIVKVSRHSYEFRVHVHDPNRDEPQNPDDNFYVVVKEDGHMRVDLLTTTRYQSSTRRTKLARPTFVPERLSPKKIAEIEAAQRAAASTDAAPGR